MSRIEEALAKLQARHSGAAKGAPERAAVESRADAAPFVEHQYGGRRIEISFDMLRANGLLAPDSDDRKLTEEYRIIKRPLLRNASPALEPPLPRGNLITVTSALPGEGKTFTCVSLCLSLAREQDWSVVLVDGDCNKPHLSRLFGVERDPGFMDLLRNPDLTFDSLVMPTNVPNLSILPAGLRREGSVELLSSASTDALCTRISEDDPKRLIVFDSPPMLLTSEAPALTSHFNQIVVVVLANKTPQRAVIAALSVMDQNKAISLLLNQATKAEAGDYGYGYGYGD